MAYRIVKYRYIICAEFWGTNIVAVPSVQILGGRVPPPPVIYAHAKTTLNFTKLSVYMLLWPWLGPPLTTM